MRCCFEMVISHTPGRLGDMQLYWRGLVLLLSMLGTRADEVT
jgi:hypothetical protein